ncbi:MAG: amidohydrolase family protein [Chloroflexota bacterium]
MPELLIAGGRVFDGTGAAPRAADVLVRDGRIASVGAPGSVAAADGAARINATGKLVLPGLIDCHVHLTSTSEANAELRRLKDTIPLQALRGADNARKMLMAGFTTVRDLSAPGWSNIAIRDAINQGLCVGPRVLAAGMSLTVPGGHGDNYYRPEVHVFREGLVNGADSARLAVREAIRMHADVIKLLVTGGVMTDGSDVGAIQWTDDELHAAIDQAHQLGRRVAGHCHGGGGVKAAVRLGLDTVEHGTMLDAEAIDLIGSRGAFLVPTLVASQNIVSNGLKAGIAPHVVRKAEEVAEWHRRSVHDAYAAKIKIAFGTDCGTPFNRPGENGSELGLMMLQGFSAADALIAATRVAADAIGLSDQIGTLEAGKRADVIVVDGDPLADISVLADGSRVSWVVRDGAVVKRPEVAA